MHRAEISRGDFLGKSLAVVAAASWAGCLMGCMTKTSDDESAAGKKFSGTKTLTAGEKATLDAQEFLNLDSVIVIKDGAAYRAFTRICPHEAGDIVASATFLQCQRHTDQSYNKLGVSNGSRTSATLTTYTVTDNAGTLTITA